MLRLLSIFRGRPGPLGVVEGRLRECPATPNCVCTQSADEGHRAAPLRFSGSAPEALARLQRILSALPRTRIVEQSENYLRAEAESWLFGFVDDVEFLVDESQGEIHFRSASRLGRSDLGVNRRRMETIRQQFEAAR